MSGWHKWYGVYQFFFFTLDISESRCVRAWLGEFGVYFATISDSTELLHDTSCIGLVDVVLFSEHSLEELAAC